MRLASITCAINGHLKVHHHGAEGVQETAGINVITCELNTVKEYAIAFHTHLQVNDTNNIRATGINECYRLLTYHKNQSL